MEGEGSFTHTINVTVLVSSTFDLFDVMCKQHNRTALNPFFTIQKTVTLTVCVNGPLKLLHCANFVTKMSVTDEDASVDGQRDLPRCVLCDSDTSTSVREPWTVADPDNPCETTRGSNHIVRAATLWNPCK